MTKTRDFKCYTTAKRFKNLMRIHGVEAQLLECRGLLKGTFTVTWKDETE